MPQLYIKVAGIMAVTRDIEWAKHASTIQSRGVDVGSISFGRAGVESPSLSQPLAAHKPRLHPSSYKTLHHTMSGRGKGGKVRLNRFSFQLCNR